MLTDTASDYETSYKVFTTSVTIEKKVTQNSSLFVYIACLTYFQETHAYLMKMSEFDSRLKVCDMNSFCFFN